jgi:hypothetical protein
MLFRVSFDRGTERLEEQIGVHPRHSNDVDRPIKVGYGVYRATDQEAA